MTNIFQLQSMRTWLQTYILQCGHTEYNCNEQEIMKYGKVGACLLSKPIITHHLVSLVIHTCNLLLQSDKAGLGRCVNRNCLGRSLPLWFACIGMFHLVFITTQQGEATKHTKKWTTWSLYLD